MKKAVAQSKEKKGLPPALAWGLVLIVVGLAFAAWGNSQYWQLVGLSTYKLFPLFGLIAFSVFWAQYVVAALALYMRSDPMRLIRFFKVTSMLVLVALLLHPGLLSYQLWLDGYGLPPMSILNNATRPSYEWIVLLGMSSWVVFMLYLITYKFHSYFQTKTWWKWFGYVGEIAMFAVFYHGLRLGDQLQSGWFQTVWIGYGIVLVLALAYLHKDALIKFRRKIAS